MIMHVMIWRYLCAWFRQLRSDPINAVFDFLKYAFVVSAGCLVLYAVANFMSGDTEKGIYYGLMGVASVIASRSSWHAQQNHLKWMAEQDAFEARLAESNEQFRARVDEALKRAAD